MFVVSASALHPLKWVQRTNEELNLITAMCLPKLGIATVIALLTVVADTSVSFYSLTSLPVPKVLAQTNSEKKAEGDRLFQQGAQQLKRSLFREALQSFQQALAIYREINDRKGEATTFLTLGLAYYGLKDYQKALDSLQQSLAIAKEIKDPKLEKLAQELLSKIQLQNNPRKAEADRLLQQGAQQLKRSLFREALQSWQQALVIYREIRDRKGEGATLRNLGVVYNCLGNYRKAIEYHQQSLAIAREIGDRKGEGQSLGNWGYAYNCLGNYRQAIEYHQQSLAIAREIGDRSDEGAALGNLGVDYNSLGDYRKAIEYHQQSLAIKQEIGDRSDEGAALSNLGNVYHSLGDYRKAIEYYQQSLAIKREIGDRSGEGTALNNLGNVYHSLGDYHKAIEYYQQSLAIKREIGDRRSEGVSLGNLATAYNSLGDYRKAIEYQQQSLAIAREIGDRRSEGTSLGNLGNAYHSLGEYRKAIEYHQQRLAITKEIGDHQGEGQSLVNLGIAYDSLGDYRKAIEYHQQSLAITREIGDLSGERAALNNLGLAFYKSGNLVEAEKTLFQGIEVSESLREKLGDDDANKVSIFEEQARTYRLLQKVLIAQNQISNALEIAERGRGRAFVELLTRRSSTNPQEIITSASLKPTINQIKQIAKNQNATLIQYSIITDEELYVWVIKPTGEVNFRKVDLKPLWQQQNTSLTELVSHSRESIGVRGITTASIARQPETNQKQNLQKLHELLIKPIAELLPTDPNSHVIFIPQRELFLVPFVSLQDEQGKYLIEKHTIITAPSIQVLELTSTKKARKNFGKTLIVGNPTMPSLALKIGEPPEQLSPLPSAQQEAIEIAKLFNTQPLIGSQAKEATIKSEISQANIIHFATHGLLDYGELQGRYGAGVPGALAFTRDEKEDGLLTSDEILDLKLNASLVVLSACDTGRGKLTGDGVIGLSRAFITAGTPSIVVSLWAVPDAPTADLMTEFYRQMKTNPNKAQALRQAMLTVMKTHPRPRDWAAFTLIGEAF